MAQLKRSPVTAMISKETRKALRSERRRLRGVVRQNDIINAALDSWLRKTEAERDSAFMRMEVTA